MPRWKPGTSGNPRGRPRGRPNNRTLAGRDVARGLLTDPEYLAAFLDAWRKRLIHPTVERLVWELHHGRPRQAVEVDVDARVRGARPLAISRVYVDPPSDGEEPTRELLDVVVPGLGRFRRDGQTFAFEAELPAAGLLPAEPAEDEDDGF